MLEWEAKTALVFSSWEFQELDPEIQTWKGKGWVRAGRGLSEASWRLTAVRPAGSSTQGASVLRGLLSAALPCSGSSFGETAVEKRGRQDTALKEDLMELFTNSL